MLEMACITDAGAVYCAEFFCSTAGTRSTLANVRLGPLGFLLRPSPSRPTLLRPGLKTEGSFGIGEGGRGTQKGGEPGVGKARTWKKTKMSGKMKNEGEGKKS